VTVSITASGTLYQDTTSSFKTGTPPEAMAPMANSRWPGRPNFLSRKTSEATSEALALALAQAPPLSVMSSSGADVGTLAQDVAKVLAPSRLRAVLVASVAVIALVGLYGLLAYIVNQRTHEIGIRLALGAPREAVFGSLFTLGARLVVVGLLLGLAAGIWLRRVVATFVFGITAGDPATYPVASVTFLLIALAAIAIPAPRAARIEPVMALRDE